MHKRQLAAFAAAIFAAGCGGGDGGSGTPSLTNFATGPVPSSPSVGAVATKTLLPSTADTHEVETDGTWVVWKARQINVGYWNGSSYSNLNLGLPGAVTPWAFDDCERSPIAFDGSRIAFIANDVGSADLPAFYYGTPGGTMRKIALPDTVSTKMPQYYGVTIHGNAAGFADMNVSPARLYRVDLSVASPAFVEVTYTGDFTEGQPGLGLVPLATADNLALLDISDGVARALPGDGVDGTAPSQVRFANGAFTWVEGGRAYFYAPGFSASYQSQLVADAAGTVTQSNPVAGPYNTYVLWEEYDSNTGNTTVKQRPWAQLGQAPNGGTIVIRTHQALLWDAIVGYGGLQAVRTGMGFIAWLGTDTNGDVQLFTYFVGQPVPSPLEIVQVTSDEGSGWGNSDSVFLFVDGSKVFFKQEFTDLHSPGRVLKVFDYAAQTTTALLDGREFQQLPLILVANGKVVALTRDHSFRLFAKRAGSSGAPVVVTPQSYDVKTFEVAGGQLVFAALDRELYLDDDFLSEYVADNNAESLIEVYGLKLAAGGSPERLTYNAQEEYAPTTDGTWAAWRDEDNYAFALNLGSGVLKWIGESNGEIRLDGGLAAWQDNNGSYVRYANLETGESKVISSQPAWDCPSIADGVIAWTTGSYINWPTGYNSAAYYYDLSDETPAETLIAGAKPGYMAYGTYYFMPVSAATDGRYITWVEARPAWDHDGDAGAVTPAVDANVVVVYDVTTDTGDVVPAADFAETGYGLTGGNEGAVCNPKISNGLIAFGAIEYGVDNPDQDNEVFVYDVAADDLVRVTNDPEGEGLWDSRVRVGGNLAVFRSGGSGSYWDWRGMVPAVVKMK